MRQLAFAIAVLLASTAGASPFGYERGVTPGGSGPNRLDVDLALLSGAASDLHDVRLYDRAGGEIAYLLFQPSSSDAKWVSGATLPAAPTKRTSGFEVDLGSLTAVDAVHFEGIAAPFLKHVTVEGSGDRARWSVLGDTTIFDLPSDRLRRHDVEFSAGIFRYLRVTWDDRSSARVVDAVVRARVHGSSIPAAPLRAGVPFYSRESERGRSRYHIDLPARGLPVTAIELRVGSGDVFRRASVTEPRLGAGEIAPAPLGTATLRQASRNGMIASDLVIPISRPESRELDIVIEDGGNRPLTIENVTLRLAPQPWICFESPDGSPLTARYGAATLAAPVYDLEAARQMLSRSTGQRARWSGPPAADAAARARPAPLKLEGAPLDRRRFRFSRHVASAPPGLTVLPLDADVLARSRQLADVRLVDSTGRQVPYVVERRAAPVVVQVQIRRHTEPKRNVSVYQLALPYPTMPEGARLVLTTSARVFSRNVELWSGADDRRGREARRITSGSWKSADAEEAAPPLSFDLPRNIESVNLSIDEGDNAPLPITSAEVHIPAYALRFYSPDSKLTLLYGDPSVEAPRYDLALLAPRLFSEPAHEVALISPPPLDTPADSTGERKFFWIAIAVVAIVLMVLVARLLAPLVREEPRTLG